MRVSHSCPFFFSVNQVGKEDVLDKLREGREATIGYYGYPLTDIDEKVQVEEGFCLAKVGI